MIEIVIDVFENKRNVVKHYTWCRIIYDKFDDKMQNKQNNEKLSKFYFYFKTFLIQINSPMIIVFFVVMCLNDWSIFEFFENMWSLQKKSWFLGRVHDKFDKWAFIKMQQLWLSHKKTNCESSQEYIRKIKLIV